VSKPLDRSVSPKLICVAPEGSCGAVYVPSVQLLAGSSIGPVVHKTQPPAALR
jgi:hypothetical protein